MHETEDLRLMLNDRWYGLNGHQVSQLHALVDRHVNSTYEANRLVNISKYPVQQIVTNVSQEQEVSMLQQWLSQKHKQQHRNKLPQLKIKYEIEHIIDLKQNEQ